MSSKKIFVFLVPLFSLVTISGTAANAQINLKNKLKDLNNKVNRRIENTIDKNLDKALDNTEEAIKGDKKDTPQKTETTTTGNSAKTSSTGSSSASSLPSGSSTSSPQKSGSTESDSLKNVFVSKFDFIPGEKIVAIESFEVEKVGDFPNYWDTDASGEIVTIAGKPGKWLKLGKDGFFLPEFYKELPENFTMEFDVMVNDEYSWFSPGLTMAITTSENTPIWKPEKYRSKSSGIFFVIHPVNASSNGGVASLLTFYNGREVMSSEQGQNSLTTASAVKPVRTKVHISLWKQGQRLRIYLNEKKYWDLPKAFTQGLVHNKLYFITKAGGSETNNFFVSNFKLAVGTPDTRSKLITEGSLTTNGITFDVSSDKLKEESYGVIREIAGILNENPSVKVKIVGHTDSDGVPAFNQELSLKRAISVQTALVVNFNIEKSRLEVEGKGASIPVVENTTPLNKALNRRVQFVKL